MRRVFDFFLNGNVNVLISFEFLGKCECVNRIDVNKVYMFNIL